MQDIIKLRQEIEELTDKVKRLEAIVVKIVIQNNISVEVSDNGQTNQH